MPALDMVAHHTLIRTVRPGHYIEIGSGGSTKLTRQAVRDGALSQLPLGVLVGIHDIDLPWDYRPGWAIRYYNEQYLLAVHLLARNEPDIVFPARRHIAATAELAGRRGVLDAGPDTAPNPPPGSRSLRC